jgi:hypothetical protein
MPFNARLLKLTGSAAVQVGRSTAAAYCRNKQQLLLLATMSDNHSMQTFDDLEVHRLDLAQNYLQSLKAQAGRPIALFAPRRVGKTFFLAEDLAPAARSAGFLPVYADIWLNRAAPLAAINHALEEALDDATVPASAVGKVAKTRVKKVAALGAELELGDEPRRRALPTEPALRFDALVARLAAASGKPVLLMLDEAQALAESNQGASVVATLRAVLQKRKREVAAVLTGSSQDALAAMLAASGGPMYQFAQLLNFPVLGDEYLDLLTRHFERIHKGKRLSLDSLRRVFGDIGYKPALMKDIVKDMSAEGSTDVAAAFKRMVADDRQVAGWRALLAPLDPLDHRILALLAEGRRPLAKDSLQALAPPHGAAPTLAKARASLDRLRRAGILTGSRGELSIEDPLLREYLRTK